MTCTQEPQKTFLSLTPYYFPMNSFDAHISLYLMIVLTSIDRPLCLLLACFWYIGLIQSLNQKANAMTNRQTICLLIGFVLGLIALNYYSIDQFEFVIMHLIRIVIIVLYAILLAIFVDVFFLLVFIVLFWTADGIKWTLDRLQIGKDQKAHHIHQLLCQSVVNVSEFLEKHLIICLTVTSD